MPPDELSAFYNNLHLYGKREMRWEAVVGYGWNWMPSELAVGVTIAHAMRGVL